MINILRFKIFIVSLQKPKLNNMHKQYRNLTKDEIQKLQSAGSTASNWKDVLVTTDFSNYTISNVNFTGKVYLSSDITLVDVSDLGTSGKTSFANGTEVGVLKEDGGLEVILYDNLTSMEAAFEVQEANTNPTLVKALQNKAQDYAKQIESDGSIIEEGAVVKHCLQLTDVHIGPYAHVIGATRLVDVSINSLREASSGVGANVIMEHVIVGSDSHVTDAAQLDNCFVGQGCHIGRMYSATQSLFFANCHFENGEACAYFAGPYSVSHHKATLMIACMTSFFNAGSGSNQSNHSYKMGPNKYGQLLRGAKLGSSSYVYWPMQIGAFSTVIMHHVGHQDLRELPFSLITEGRDGLTHIIPAQAFRSVGTRRDALKWPKRDKRTEGKVTRRDLLNFSMLNPYTIASILKAIEVLQKMQNEGATEYKKCIISPKHIERGIALYNQAVKMYLAQVLKASDGLTASFEGTGEWTDFGGMLVPKAEMFAVLEAGKTFEDVEPLVAQYEYNWAAAHFDLSDKATLIADGEKAEAEWNAALDEDGERDVAVCNIEL